jgi:hypothetical protein
MVTAAPAMTLEQLFQTAGGLAAAGQGKSGALQ